MSSHLDSVLGRALAIRINLQISLSSLPVVEEWMDIHLNRWLESVPLPPEMPMGHTAHFGVTLAADLSRLSWRAYGDPSGFIPKMIKYLEVSKISAADTALLDKLGETLEPKLVGSWISVIGDTITTGWHFCDAHPVAELVPFLADSEAKHQLMEWASGAGITTFQRFTQAIGDNPYSEIELVVPGVAVDDQLQHTSQAFTALAGAPLSEPVIAAMSSAVATGFSVGVRIEDGRITKVSALSPGLGNDMVAEMCTGSHIAFDNKLTNLQGALHAEGADRVEYGRILGSDRSLVDVHIIPSDTESVLPQTVN